MLFYENRESLVLGGRWVGGRDENREALVFNFWFSLFVNPALFSFFISPPFYSSLYSCLEDTTYLNTKEYKWRHNFDEL